MPKLATTPTSNASFKFIDPDFICAQDRTKLVAIYEKVCPADILLADDQRRPIIAAEMLEVGLAETVDQGMRFIQWWNPRDLADIRNIVLSIRRSFAKLKLKCDYAAEYLPGKATKLVVN